MTYRELTIDERAALEAFALAHGRNWRSKLVNYYWVNARIWRGGDGLQGYTLHRIRNEFGQKWLWKIYKPRKA